MLENALHHILQLIHWSALLLHALLRDLHPAHRLKALLREWFSNGDATETANRPAVVPEHLALMFLVGDQITSADFFKLITCLVERCLNAGIKRLSLYDPFSLIYERRHELQAYLLTQKRKGVFGGAVLRFADVGVGEGGSTCSLNICILGRSHGRESLVRAAKELCHSQKKIDSSRIQKYMEERESLLDPDFVLKVGPCYGCLAGYSPWNLRVSEFQDVTLASNHLTEKKFDQLLKLYASRDRRKGA